MAFVSTSHSSCLCFFKTTPSFSSSSSSSSSFRTKQTFLFKPNPTPKPRFPSFPPLHTSVSDPSDPDPKKPSLTDEWGERVDPGSEPEYQNSTSSDPPQYEDEWEEGVGTKEEYVEVGNGPAGSGGIVEKEDKVGDLKRALVDSFYGTFLGFRASPEDRAEVSELVNQLDALNPNPAPVDSTGLLDGNWVFLYTAFSELLPLLALNSIPLLKVEKITQSIDTSTSSIVNSTTISSPFASFSFSASATFEVRSPSRIQVKFKEGTLQPPEIKSSASLPENVDLFGQTINLSAIQQTLNPLQEAVANISRIISGQPPLKVPIPDNGASSWLLVTYLDEDLRISRGDGGLFILAKEGSPLLDQ